MRRFVFFSLSAIVLFGGGSGFLAFYPPLPADLGGAADLDDAAAHVRIPVAGADSLDGWLIERAGSGLVVVLHGYGRRHTRAWRYAGFLGEAGYSILAVDLRSSRARNRLPTTLGHYEREDVDAVLAWVRAQPALAREPLGLLGESLGASVALLAAADHAEVRAVVADCPFASSQRAIEDAMVRWLHVPAQPTARLVRWLGIRVTGVDPGATDVVPAARALGDRPIFFIHTGKDDRMAPEQARDLWRAAGEKDPIWFIPDVGHNQGWQKKRAAYEARVLEFFARHLRGERAA